jgi:hypothetical protein
MWLNTGTWEGINLIQPKIARLTSRAMQGKKISDEDWDPNGRAAVQHVALHKNGGDGQLVIGEWALTRQGHRPHRRDETMVVGCAEGRV